MSKLNLSLPSDADEWPAPGTPQAGDGDRPLTVDERLFLVDDDIARLKIGLKVGTAISVVIWCLVSVGLWWLL